MHLRDAWGLVGVALLAGCAGFQGVFKEPDVHLDRVVLREVGVTGGRLDLVLGVYNPNGFELKGTRVQLGFDVEGSHVGDLEYATEFQVQQGDTTALTLPLRFNWTGVAGAVRTALASGDLPYTLKGQLTVQTPIGGHQIPFTRQGRAPLTRVAGAIPIPVGLSAPSTKEHPSGH